MTRLLPAAVALCFLAVSLPAAATPFVINGDFEMGSFAGWTTLPRPGPGSLFGVAADRPHSGTYAAAFGGVNDGYPIEDRILQNIDTVAGEFYRVSFWVEEDGPPNNCFPPSEGTPPPGVSACRNDISLRWNGEQIFYIQQKNNMAYTQFSFDVMATGGSSILEFAAADEEGWMRLDDVTIDAVPEPASITLLATGVAVWAAKRRRRNRVS